MYFCHENCEFDSNIEFHGCIFVLVTVFMPVVKIFIDVPLSIWKFFFAKFTPKMRIDKNTPIYCQKHSHFTFASRKNAMYLAELLQILQVYCAV